MKQTKLLMLFLLTFLMFQSCQKVDEPELPPIVVKIKVESETNLKVQFDRNLEPTAAQVSSNYKLIFPDHKFIQPTAAKVTGSEVLLTFSDKIQTGNYSLDIANVRSSAGAMVLMDYSANFNVE